MIRTETLAPRNAGLSFTVLRMSTVKLDLVTVVSKETNAEISRFGEALAATWMRLSPDRRGRTILVSSDAPPALVELAAATIQRATSTSPELVGLASNRGSAHAYNAGFSRSEAPLVALLDPDGAPDEDLLAQLVETVDAAPDVAAAAARVIGFDAETSSADVETADVDWVSAGATVYRREVFARVGGFDELFAGYCEDMDYGWRVRAAGWRCLLVGDVVFRHRTGAAPSFRKSMALTEYMMVWRHIHFSRRVTAKSWLMQLRIVAGANAEKRPTVLAGTTVGLLAYLRHIPACERRRSA